jgi:hypothetical protein
MLILRDGFSSHGAHAWSIFVASIVLLVGVEGTAMAAGA